MQNCNFSAGRVRDAVRRRAHCGVDGGTISFEAPGYGVALFDGNGMSPAPFFNTHDRKCGRPLERILYCTSTEARENDDSSSVR